MLIIMSKLKILKTDCTVYRCVVITVVTEVKHNLGGTDAEMQSLPMVVNFASHP